jgi:uncharacterized protein (DUF427 family)
MRDAMRGRLHALRHEPTERRVRAALGGEVVVDTLGAVLVWEPRRVVPSYAVPAADLRAELAPAAALEDAGAPVLHPGIPFGVHSAPGETLDVRVGGEMRARAAFRPADQDLAGLVVLDFFAFDAWHEEDEDLVGHPRDPYHRIDIRAASRHVRIERDGELLAESARPTLLFETSLPTRFYIPREDVAAPLGPSDRRTTCAYKGHASYFSVGGRDLAWTYERPLREAAAIKNLVAFFNELVDVTVDGVRRDRPVTAFSRAIVEETRI